MAITFAQYLQSLLQSVTTYYTATYSNDTVLYDMLQMYSSEFTSGSIALETVRNNLFIVACENSKLYDNFGTYFDQNKYTDQTYIEDRYVSGSGTFKITTPTLKITQSIESSDSWMFISHDQNSVVTNFPYSFDLDTATGQPLAYANAVSGKLYMTCTCDIPPVPGVPQTQTPLIRLVYYAITTNTWDEIPTVCGDVVGSDWGKLDTSGKLVVTGLIAYQSYSSQGEYNPVGLYSFDFYPTDFNAIGDTWSTLNLVGVKYFNLDTTPEYFRTEGFLRLNSLDIPNISYTASVDFHDKIYMAIASKSPDGPDNIKRWPFLVYYDPITNTAGTTGLAVYLNSVVGSINFQAHAMAKYENKLWIDVSQEGSDIEFFSTQKNSTESSRFPRDFESSGSTIFAATGPAAVLLYSTDDGDIWNEKVDLSYIDPTPGQPATLYSCKEFDALDGSGSFLYVGTDNSLIVRARAPHTSGSWSQASSGSLSIVTSLETFNGALFAATASGAEQHILRTTNGTSWTHVNASPASVVDKGGWYLKEFNSYLYAAGDVNNKVIRSSDGIVWENTVDGLGTAGTAVAAPLETHNNYLYAANNSNQITRTNNGTTWHIQYTGFTSQISTILSYRDTLYVGLINGELWNSTDDGLTFTLFQTSDTILKLDAHNNFAFCSTSLFPNGAIFKWGGGGAQHYMTTYDGINFEAAASPANIGDSVPEMHPYDTKLYAIVNNSTGGYSVRRYYNVPRNLPPFIGETKGLWRFNGTLDDDSGNGNTLTGTSVVYYSGYTEPGLTAIRQLVTIDAANATDFDFGTNSFTIEGWYKLGNQTEVLLQKGISNHGGPGYRLIHFGATDETQDRLRCELTDSNNLKVDVDTIAGSVTPNTWVYIAVVVNRLDGTAQIYIDGKAAVNASENISSWSGNIGDATQDFFILGYTTAYFDEICITAKALTSTEINNRAGKIWETHQSFEYPINTMHEHAGTLILSTSDGTVFHLDTGSDIWIQYTDIPGLSTPTNGVASFASYAMSTPDLYALADNGWYSSGFISNNIINYAIPGAGVSGSTTQCASIPGYKKQLDFMLDAAMNGGTHQGIIRASNAFTLINPDIREAYTTPQWKLKYTSGPITQLGSNIWQFSDSPSWRDNLWQGAHMTLISGSTVSDKITVGYIISVNDNNTVNIGPIYDSNLLLDLTRPN